MELESLRIERPCDEDAIVHVKKGALGIDRPGSGILHKTWLHAVQRANVKAGSVRFRWILGVEPWVGADNVVEEMISVRQKVRPAVREFQSVRVELGELAGCPACLGNAEQWLTPVWHEQNRPVLAPYGSSR